MDAVKTEHNVSGADSTKLHSSEVVVAHPREQECMAYHHVVGNVMQVPMWVFEMACSGRLARQAKDEDIVVKLPNGSTTLLKGWWLIYYPALDSLAVANASDFEKNYVVTKKC